MATVMSFLVIGYCYWFVSVELKLMRRQGFEYLLNTFSDLWTILEWVNVFMIIAQVIIRLQASCFVHLWALLLRLRVFQVTIRALQGYQLDSHLYIPLYQLGEYDELSVRKLLVLLPHIHAQCVSGHVRGYQSVHLGDASTPVHCSPSTNCVPHLCLLQG